MSHFAVIVITPPSPEPFADVLRKQLQPYHEFECTGIDDEYVQDIDRTEEALEAFNADKNTYLVNEATGQRLRPYDDQFYRDPTEKELAEIGPIAGSGCGHGLSWSSRDWQDGKGYRTKVQYIPDGWKEVEIPACEMESFAEWIEGYYGVKTIPFGQEPDIADEHKYGYTLVDAEGKVTKTVDRTNPNRQWDWWQVGGRYSNRLTTFAGQKTDSAKKGEIDFPSMEREKAANATAEWNAAQAILDGTDLNESWASVRERVKDIDAARAFYNEQPRVKKWREATRQHPILDGFFSNAEDYAVPLVEFLSTRCAPLTGFAVLKDGQWFERGKMGWWACVSNEKDGEDWQKEFDKLIFDLPEDHAITIVDCHI